MPSLARGRNPNFTHGMWGTPEYRAWNGMKQRCLLPTNKSYPRYGGRGITIHPEWIDSFQAFYDHIGKRPTPKHTLDRINNDGNYEPGNVRWATWAVNQANRNYDKSQYGFIGVFPNYHNWLAKINHEGELYYLGTFKDIEQAALAYDCAAIQLRGDVGRLNYLSVIEKLKQTNDGGKDGRI